MFTNDKFINYRTGETFYISADRQNYNVAHYPKGESGPYVKKVFRGNERNKIMAMLRQAGAIGPVKDAR